MTRISNAIQRLLVQQGRQHGEKRLDNGVWLVQPAPEIAPKAWRHVIYPPLRENEIIEMEKNLHERFPHDLFAFYEAFNGISLFGGGIVIWGKRQSYVRQGDGIWQPFDIIQHNSTGERPVGSPYQIIYFGSLDQGASRLFFYNRSGEIGKTPASVFDRKALWPDFESFFFSEFEKLDN